MSVFQAEVIDGLNYDKKHNIAYLYIKDVLTFENEDIHLRLLNQKLANYLSFIVSGELDEYIESKDYDKEIIIDFISDPPQNIKKILNYYHESLDKRDIELRWTVTSLKS